MVGLDGEVAFLGNFVLELPSYAEQAASRSQNHSLDSKCSAQPFFLAMLVQKI